MIRFSQDAFTESYLTTQKSVVFKSVGVLIYVFDVESREFDGRDGQNFRDLNTYNAVIKALEEYSPEAHVFTLVHKMDLVQNEHRERVLQDKTEAIRERSEGFQQRVQTYGTSIWDQTLYKAWGMIVHSLIPDLEVIEWYLRRLAHATDAEEIVLFERVTFLTVTSFTTKPGKKNPYFDRYERLSNIIKTFKNSLSNFTSALPSIHHFAEYVIKTPRFNLILAKFTTNTYVLVVIPPGEAELQCTRLNILAASEEFAQIDQRGREEMKRLRQKEKKYGDTTTRDEEPKDNDTAAGGVVDTGKFTDRSAAIDHVDKPDSKQEERFVMIWLHLRPSAEGEVEAFAAYIHKWHTRFKLMELMAKNMPIAFDEAFLKSLVHELHQDRKTKWERKQPHVTSLHEDMYVWYVYEMRWVERLISNLIFKGNFIPYLHSWLR